MEEEENVGARHGGPRIHLARSAAPSLEHTIGMQSRDGDGRVPAAAIDDDDLDAFRRASSSERRADHGCLVERRHDDRYGQDPRVPLQDCNPVSRTV